MADRAADDPAQHVAAALVRGQHAVGDQERARTDVVGDHAQRRGLAIRGARRPGRRDDQLPEKVDVVVAVHALHHGGDALEAHPGVDRGLRQRRHRAVGRAVVLHEHEVPDLDVSVAVLVRRARRAAFDAGAVVVEDLGAGTARAGVAHRPEVRLHAHPREARGIDADLLQPDLGRPVVLFVDRHPQPLGRNAERPGDEVPRIADRLALEVVAEAEVAEHLEERMVPRRVADVLEVVVLAACTHAALGARRSHVAAGLLAEEHVLELHHAGVGEQQRRVVARHQRARGHHGVAMALEEVQECGPQLGAAHAAGGLLHLAHDSMFSPGPSAARTCSAEKPRYCRKRACLARSR